MNLYPTKDSIDIDKRSRVLYLVGNLNRQVLTVESIMRDKIDVIRYSEKIDIEFLKYFDFSHIVSFGYRHIISKDVIDYFDRHRMINIHISYLPWNRGADPNIWSILENTPRGVTIHNIDYGIDTGPIIAQRQIPFSKSIILTFESTYNELLDCAVNLFKEWWGSILKFKFFSINQRKDYGSYHSKEHFDFIKKNVLINGYKTSINDAYKAYSEILEIKL